MKIGITNKMWAGNYKNKLNNDLPFFPSKKSMEQRAMTQRMLENQNQVDSYKDTKQIWTSDDLLQIFKQYKRYGNQWSIIAQGFSQINSQNIKNRFFGLARRALRMMMKLQNRKGEGSLTDFVSNIHTKALILGINQVVKFKGKRREVVMLDVIKKYAFIRNFNPDYTASLEESIFIENCIEYFLCLNNVIIGRSKSIRSKRISKMRNVPFKFYKNDRKTSFKQFLIQRRDSFKRENLNQRNDMKQAKIEGFRKIIIKPDIIQKSLGSSVNTRDISNKAPVPFSQERTRKWSGSIDTKSNIIVDKTCEEKSSENAHGFIRFQSGNKFDLLGYFKKSLSRQNTREFEENTSKSHKSN